ncbi:MAG: hypothetical protein QW112_01940 [Candidatus Micrarchaeia archaeon]
MNRKNFRRPRIFRERNIWLSILVIIILLLVLSVVLINTVAPSLLLSMVGAVSSGSPDNSGQVNINIVYNKA